MRRSGDCTNKLLWTKHLRTRRLGRECSRCALEVETKGGRRVEMSVSHSDGHRMTSESAMRSAIPSDSGATDSTEVCQAQNGFASSISITGMPSRIG